MKKVYVRIRKFTKKLQNDDVSAYASSIAFFLFMSMIPILIIICAAIPYTPLTEADVMVTLIDVTPASIDPLIVSLVSQVYDKSAGVLSIAIVVTIWSAGKGMLALMRALNRIHGTQEERGYFRLRAIASFYTVVVLVVVIITLCLGVFGEYFVKMILRNISILEKGIAVINYIRVLFVLGLSVIAFTFIYTYIPDKKLSLWKQIPGAVFTSLGWNVFSYGFAIYVEHFTGLSAYGTMGTIVLFLLWLYFCSYIILVGANVNLYINLKRGFEDRAGKSEKKF